MRLCRRAGPTANLCTLSGWPHLCLPLLSAGVSRAVSRAVSRMVTMQKVPLEKEGDLLLALLPHYRRSTKRHPVLEALIELVLPAVVLAMGLFFSISTLVLLFE